MTSVDINKAVTVYSGLNEAYTRLEKNVLSSVDRERIACFLRLYGDRASNAEMMNFWYDKAFAIKNSGTLNNFDKEIVKEVLFAALKEAFKLLCKCGVKVHDEEPLNA